jgi:hypothetical protein
MSKQNSKTITLVFLFRPLARNLIIDYDYLWVDTYRDGLLVLESTMLPVINASARI